MKKYLFKKVINNNGVLSYLKNKVVGYDNNHILVAAMMKCGGTYLATVLSRLPGFIETRLVPAHGRREQELDILYLFLNRRDYVAHHHLRYSEALDYEMKIFNIKPIIVTRDIFDVLVSMRDYILSGANINQIIYLPKNYEKMSDDEIYLMLVHHFLPWYFNFYLSWRECSSVIFISYEEFNKDIKKTIHKIVDFYQINVSELDIEHAINETKLLNTRKNKAIVGRGNNLSKEIKQAVINMSACYKEYDLTGIGLPIKSDIG